MKKVMLMVAALSAIGATVPVAANTKGCPYDLRDSGLSSEEIKQICDEWERSQRGDNDGGKDGRQFPGKNCYGPCWPMPH